jgi:hypothetical protein
MNTWNREDTFFLLGTVLIIRPPVLSDGYIYSSPSPRETLVTGVYGSLKPVLLQLIHLVQKEEKESRRAFPQSGVKRSGGWETLSSHTTQTTRNRGILRQASATCPVNGTMIWQPALRDKREYTCNKHGELRRGRGSESDPAAPGPSLGGPGAARSRTRRRKPEGLQGKETAPAYHGDTRPRVACGECTPGRTACKGGRACKWLGEDWQALPAGPAGRGPGAWGASGRALGEVVTVWFTPHIRTLRIGSLARNSFTFWHTKCFFLVLVLLALSGATATAVVLVQLDDMPGAAAAAAAKREAAETAHKPAAPGLPRTDPHPRCLTVPWSRPSRYLPTPPRWFRPPHAPPSPPRPREPASPLRTPPPGGTAACRHQALSSPPEWFRPSRVGSARPARPSSRARQEEGWPPHASEPRAGETRGRRMGKFHCVLWEGLPDQALPQG